jgi:hypothetical protein
MTFGPYGTAIWTDTHTEHYFGHADRGQRLAGKFLSGRDIQDAAADSVYLYQEEDSWVSLALDEAEGRIIIGYNDGRISMLEYI